MDLNKDIPLTEQLPNSPEKPNQLAKAYELLENVRTRLDFKTIQTLKLCVIAGMITSAVAFGYFFRIKWLMMALIVSGILLLIGLFSLEKFFFPDGNPNKIEKEDKMNRKTSKKKDKADDLGLDYQMPTIDQLSDNFNEAIVGKKKGKKSKDPYGLDNVYQVA